MQRGLNALARRSVLPQPFSPTCLVRGPEGGSKAKKRVKPWQRYKGPLKGKLDVLFTANNKWKYNWYRKHEDLPEELKRLEMHIPYYNATVQYNPNDPAEIKSFMGKLRASKLRQQNEDFVESKGVKTKQWYPDQRLIDNDETLDDDDRSEQMEEEYGPDEDDIEWRDTREKKELLQLREQRQKERRANLSGESHKRILEFEKMSNPEKVKKLTEYRDQFRALMKQIDEARERALAMTDEEALERLRKEFNFTDDDVEQLLREQEAGVSAEEKDAFEKQYKLGKYKEAGKPSGLDIYFKEKGHEELIGFQEELWSDAPPKVPPPIDVTKLRFYKKMQEEEAFKKKEEPKKEEKAAVPAAGKPAAPAGKGKAKA